MPTTSSPNTRTGTARPRELFPPRRWRDERGRVALVREKRPPDRGTVRGHNWTTYVAVLTGDTTPLQLLDLPERQTRALAQLELDDYARAAGWTEIENGERTP